MLAPGRISSGKRSAGSVGVPQSRRVIHACSSRRNTPRSRHFGTAGRAPVDTLTVRAANDDSERSVVLSKRAAAIAKKLIEQRQEQGGERSQALSSPLLDKSLTTLLTSLLGTLADATTPGPAPSANKAPNPPSQPPNLSDSLVQLLTQWADEFLVSDGNPSSSTKAIPGANPADGNPTSVAKTLFMQLLAELLPPAEGTTTGPGADNGKGQQGAAAAGKAPASGLPSVGRGLLAATAAAFTAREAASRLQVRLQGEGVSAGVKVKAAERSSSTDSFDPDAWEAAARAAAEAAAAEDDASDAVNITPGLAAAAVATNTTDFCPDAWEVAAAAAAAAATAEDGQSQSHPSRPADRSASRLAPLPEPCWAVRTLSEALQAATESGLQYAQSAQPTGHSAQTPAAGSNDSSGSNAPCVQELLLLPAPEAAQQLRQLPAAQRAGLLLLLCGADGVQATGASIACFGSRGEAWLLMVLDGVAADLGLLEIGVLLAAICHRHGEGTFLRASSRLLPLTDTTDPSMTLAPASAPPPAAAPQALLLHWLLQPQLAAAGLPLLSESLLLRLLPQLLAACSIRQLSQAAHWGSLWPPTKLFPGLHPQGNEDVILNSGSGGEGSKGGFATSSHWQVSEPRVESTVSAAAWCGFPGVPMPWVAHVAAAAAAKIIHGTSSTSCSSSSYSRQLSQGDAAAAADARAVLCAVIRGLEPAEPQLLLLMQAVQQLQPGLAGLTAGSTAEPAWKQQLQQLLLEAYSGTALPVTTLADLIHRSVCIMWRLGQDGTDAVHTPNTQQQQVLDAAAAVLAALPAQQLQQELHTLFSMHQETASGPQVRVGPHSQHQAVLGSILAATAAVAEPAQAAAMLAVLSMPFWADAWATLVSPVAGSFCWSRQQLVATMQGIYPPAAAVAAVADVSSAGSNWGQLQAAWEVVAAHFNLQEVVAEVSTRPRAPDTVSTGPDSTNTTNSGVGDCTPVQPSSKPFDSISSRSYSYRPGVPFSGDGWDQDQDAPHPAPAVACFSGSLGAFVCEVLSSAPLPVAAAHIAALAEALPAQAFARVAAVLVPRLVSALDTLGTSTAGEIPTASSTLAGPAWSSPSASGVSTGLGQHGLGKSLLKLYGSLPELPEAPYAMQLLATAAPHLPLDRTPQLITTASRLAPRLRKMPWLPGAHCLSSGEDESYDSSPELTAISQTELVVAAAASGRDSMGLQHMLAMLVRQLPLKEAHVAFRVLQGLTTSAGLGLGAAQVAGVSPRTQLPYTAVEEASSILRQRCDDTTAAAPAAAAGTASATSGRAGGRVVSESLQGGEVVWQLGQSDAAAKTPAAAREALGSFVQGWGSTPAANAAANTEGGSSSASSESAYDADREVVRRLAEVVSDIPHAPPAGSWPMDAMHSPSYTAPLLKSCLALLVDWAPSSPAAAALAAQQLNILAAKRHWTSAEASAFLQRLPLHTALQLLLEAGSGSARSSSSSSSSKMQLLVSLRPKLLRALVDWQGSEAVTQGLRELLVGYHGQALTSFAEVLSDVHLALSGPSGGSSSSSDGPGAAAPNAYVAAVITLLEVLLPPSSSSSGGSSRHTHQWSQKLSQALVHVSAQVPKTVAARLAEQVGRSFTDTQQKPTSASTPAAAAWQADIATFLAALPAAGQQQQQEWVPVAVSVTTAVSESAGSAAALDCIKATLQATVQDPSAAARAAWAAALASVLGQLQQQGVLTCGVAYSYSSFSGVSTGGNSTPGTRFAAQPGPVTPSCISLQLLQLLQDLYHTERVISLQQAAASILAVQVSLGKALPMAVAVILGGGSMRSIRGYGATGPDSVTAAAALESATAEVTSRHQPTAAALPAATAAAARQLSEALARCHELLSEQLMVDLMTALAGVLPWTDLHTPATAPGSGPTSSSSSSGSKVCPAEAEMSHGGWGGVTQLLLITSSLLTASCRVWGVDKGTQVAASLIEKLVTPPAAAAGGLPKTVSTPGCNLSHSRSAGELQGSSSRSRPSIRRSVSSGFLAKPSAAASSSSSSHAARAEAALYRATAATSSSNNTPDSRFAGRTHSRSQAATAAGKLQSAADTGGTAQPGSQASKAAAALLAAASGTNTQAGAAAAKLQAAAASGGQGQPGSQAGRAAAALLEASGSSGSSGSSSGVGSHAARAEGKLLYAAVASGGQAVLGSHAAKAKAALLKAAASGLDTPPSSAAAGGSGTQDQHAQHALLNALASGRGAATADSSTAATVASAATEADADSVPFSSSTTEAAAWGTAQLLAAADAWYWPGLTTAKGLVQGLLYPRYYHTAAEAGATPGYAGVAGRAAGRAGSAAAEAAVLSPCEAAEALAAALPRLAADLPTELTAEVLGQVWGSIPSAAWTSCLHATAAALVTPVGSGPSAAAAAAAGDGQYGGHAVGGQLLEVLCAAANSLQEQLEPSKALPAAYAELLLLAASKLPSSSVSQLLQQMLRGWVQQGEDEAGFAVGFEAQGLSSEGFAQLLLELSRPGAATAVLTSSSGSSLSEGTSQQQQQQQWQLELVASVASEVFGPATTSIEDVTPADVAGALSGRLYQADLLPRTYLTLLLQPYFSSAKNEVCVKQLGITTGHTPAAIAALAELCYSLGPGKKLPLASYAQILAVALDLTVASKGGFSKVGYPEARVGMELERQQTLQQLLGGVVAVLGTFRGMRQLHTSPLGAQILLPMHDLAAVLCYSWQLLPSAAAARLAEAVAAALAALPGEQLPTLLQLLPNAAGEGFGKGAELWRPLLHTMAVAGGMSELQEGSLTQKLLAVCSQQVPSYPLQMQTGQGDATEGLFADPAAVAAALAPAAANNEVGLSAGRVSRSTAGGYAAAAGAAAAAAEAEAAAADVADTAEGSDEQQKQQDGEEEADELTEADAALLATAGAAYLSAALSGFTPAVVFMGAMSTLLVAALGATQTSTTPSTSSTTKPTESTPNNFTPAVTPTTTSSHSGPDNISDSTAAVESFPSSPRTPTTTDTTSSTSSRRHATMGGRTKAVTFAEPTGDAAAAAADGSAMGAAGVPGYGAAAAAAAAATAAGRSGGVSALGSLAVDPDEVVRKIKGHATQLPLDEALMEVVPLLLLPADASSFTWPLLGLSAILYSKFPRLHSLLGPGGPALTNMALAATLVNPDGPLAAVMHASQLLTDESTGLGFADSSSSGSGTGSGGPDKRDLLAALAAAEAVHPHAVAMQLAERLLNALWAVLTGSILTSSSSSGSGSIGGVGTPEGAAAAWQQVATQLLLGVDGATAVKLLGAFAHRQQGNWEAQLRVLAVAAALQGSGCSCDRGGHHQKQQQQRQLLSELLGEVCAANSHPPLSFLSLLLHNAEVPLSSSDTTAVLTAALDQLTASYSTQLRNVEAGSISSNGSAIGSGTDMWGEVGVTGEFDSWGFDALAGAQGLLGDQGLGEALQGFDSSFGPRYQGTSSFYNGGSNSSGYGGGFSARAKLSAVPGSVIRLVGSLVEGACSRGHAAEAVLFLTQVVQLSHKSTISVKAAAAVGSAAGVVLVVDGEQEQQLLQLAVMAVSSSLGKAGEGRGQETASQTAAAAAAAASATAAGCGHMPRALSCLLDVLGDSGHLSCVNELVTLVCQSLAGQYMQHAGVYSTPRAVAADTSSSSSSSSWVGPGEVGQMLVSAAAGVRKSEGVLSAAKPAGGLFLATAADALFGDSRLSVEQCLVLLAAVAAHLPERLGLQIVAAAAGRLHSVMPQAVSVVRQVAAGKEE